MLLRQRQVSKSKTPDILKKSHRHLDGDERAQAKEALRRNLLDLDDEDGLDEDSSFDESRSTEGEPPG